MSASDLFLIGSSGTRAYQAAMGAIADNIANADTPGYSRRTVELIESPASASTSVYYRSAAAFGGVVMNAVRRSSDDYLDAAARATANALGSVDQRARWMTDIQSAMNDGSLGVGQRITGMFTAIERLASNPTDTTLRTDFLFSLEQINAAFKQSSTDLKTVRAGIGSTATSEVTALNDAIGQLATANEGLRRTLPGTAAHVQLIDARDQALGEISKRINITIDYGANDTADIKFNGADVVANVKPYFFGVSQADDGTLDFTLDGASVVEPTGGALGGLASSATITKSRIDSLNTLAQQYVTDLNSWHTQGRTNAGAVGQPLLSIGADAATLDVLITDPAAIAVVSAAGVSNGNLIAASALRGDNSIEANWTNLVSLQGNLVASTLAEQTASQKRDDLAQNARGDVSGVNLDREAADLLRLQQAYQGSAKVIQVARELMQVIFSII